MLVRDRFAEADTGVARASPTLRAAPTSPRWSLGARPTPIIEIQRNQDQFLLQQVSEAAPSRPPCTLSKVTHSPHSSRSKSSGQSNLRMARFRLRVLDRRGSEHRAGRSRQFEFFVYRRPPYRRKGQRKAHEIEPALHQRAGHTCRSSPLENLDPTLERTRFSKIIATQSCH